MKQELLQAARLIQNYCRSNENCEECPFDNDMDCKLSTDLPCWWDIRNDVKEKENEEP